MAVLEILMAIITIARVLHSLLGPTIARLTQAEMESIRAKNPNAGKAIDLVGEVFAAVVDEIETAATMRRQPGESQKDFNHRRREGAIVEGVARLLARGIHVDEADARIKIEQAIKAGKVLAGGKSAAPDAPAPVS